MYNLYHAFDSSSHHLFTIVFFPFEITVMRLADGLSVKYIFAISGEVSL